MRTSIAALLAGLLVILTAGCAGAEETGGSAQRTGKETKKEHTGARDTGGHAGARKATLEMSGDPGISFSGSCIVGDEESKLSGKVLDSFVYHLNGRRIDCEIRRGRGR